MLGCVTNPRQKSELVHRADAMEFSGLFEVPGVDLEVQAKNQRTQSWVRFATARTRNDNPLIGPSGSPYFRYSLTTALPQSPDYWIAQPGRGRIEAQVRVTFGERVLALFDSDAESCVRRADSRGLAEREAVASCAVHEPEFARVFVAACGGEGEPCCPRAGAAEGCNDAYVCSASVCRQPAYPPPIVPGYQVDLSLPHGYTLRDAWLVMDDRAQGPDSERRLLEDYRPESGVERELPYPGVARLRFDVGLWKPGLNRFYVKGLAASGGERRLVQSPQFSLSYSLPRQLGMLAAGHFQLPAQHFPRLMRDCREPHCKDADGDGLNDLWENVTIEQLRPRLMLDANDQLFERHADAVVVLTSLVPIERRGESYVLLASVVTFSRDYGHLGGFDHPGDTEAFGMLFKVDESDGLSWVASAAKGHHCLTCSPRFGWLDQEFAVDGTPQLYVEQDKHGLWQNGRSCREHAAFSCKGDRVLRPSAINIGDYSADGSRGLIDGLSGLSPNGPFGQLAGVFPGDAVWGLASRVPGRFCGGRSGCSASNSANQPGRVIANLLELFAQRVQGLEARATTRVQ
jgi:hypothetical protein